MLTQMVLELWTNWISSGPSLPAEQTLERQLWLWPPSTTTPGPLEKDQLPTTGPFRLGGLDFVTQPKRSPVTATRSLEIEAAMEEDQEMEMLARQLLAPASSATETDIGPSSAPIGLTNSESDDELDLLALDILQELDGFAKPDAPFVSQSDGGMCGSIYSNKVANCLVFWQSIGTPAWVIDSIINGISISFVENVNPQLFPFANNRFSALSNESFVDEEIEKLLAEEAIRLESTRPAVVNPLSVATSAKGKFRLILDLSELNAFVEPPRFKCEDMGVAWPSFSKNSFALAFDLKSGYHHVKINENSRKFLGFFWKGRYFVFNVLPFGLCSAPFIFTKFLRPLVRKWRSQGITIFLYLDDGLALCPDEKSATETALLLRRDLESAGLTVAETKCEWNPSRVIEWLGHVIDLDRKIVRVTEARVDKLLERLDQLEFSSAPSIRDRRIVCGTLASFYHVIEGTETIFSRAFLDAVNNSNLADQRKLALSEGEKTAIKFWRQNAHALNIRSCAVEPEPQFELAVDASATGFGGVMRNVSKPGPTFRFARDGDSAWNQKSSSFRELFAIVCGLDIFRERFCNKTIKLKTDNLNAVSIIRKGSPIPELNEMAIRIFQLKSQNNFRLNSLWVPRAENMEADKMSRFCDIDDWGVSQPMANKIMSELGRCDVDLCASSANTKCSRFVSRWCDPKSAAVDCISSFEVIAKDYQLAWLVSPPRLIPKLVSLAGKYRLNLILGCPLWESHYFFPTLRSRDGWNKFVKKVIVIQAGEPFIY